MLYNHRVTLTGEWVAHSVGKQIYEMLITYFATPIRVLVFIIEKNIHYSSSISRVRRKLVIVDFVCQLKP